MSRLSDGFFYGAGGGAILLAAFVFVFFVGCRVGTNLVLEDCKQYGAYHDAGTKLECKALP